MLIERARYFLPNGADIILDLSRLGVSVEEAASLERRRPRIEDRFLSILKPVWALNSVWGFVLSNRWELEVPESFQQNILSRIFILLSLNVEASENVASHRDLHNSSVCSTDISCARRLPRWHERHYSAPSRNVMRRFPALFEMDLLVHVRETPITLQYTVLCCIFMFLSLRSLSLSHIHTYIHTHTTLSSSLCSLLLRELP